MPVNTQMSLTQKRQQNIEIIRQSLRLPKKYESTETDKELLQQEKDRLESLPKKIKTLKREIASLKENGKAETEVTSLQKEIKKANREAALAKQSLDAAIQKRKDATVTPQDLLKQQHIAIENNTKPILVLQQKMQDALQKQAAQKNGGGGEIEPLVLMFPMAALKEICGRKKVYSFFENIDNLEEIESILEENKNKQDTEMVELAREQVTNISKILAKQSEIIKSEIKTEAEKEQQGQTTTAESFLLEEEQYKQNYQEKKAELDGKREALEKLPLVMRENELKHYEESLKEYQQSGKKGKHKQAATVAAARRFKIDAKKKMHQDIKKNVTDKITTRLAKVIDENSKNMKANTSAAKTQLNQKFEAQRNDLRSDTTAALESAVEYCIAKLEGADDSVQEKLKRKCYGQQWKAARKTEELTYRTPVDLIEMSDIFELTYYGYLDIASENKGVPLALREELQKYKESLASADKPSKAELSKSTPAAEASAGNKTQEQAKEPEQEALKKATSQIQSEKETQVQETDQKTKVESLGNVDKKSGLGLNVAATKLNKESNSNKPKKPPRAQKKALEAKSIQQRLVDEQPKPEPMKPVPKNFPQKVTYFENFAKKPDAPVVKKVLEIKENKPLEPPQEHAAPPIFLSKTANHVGTGHLEAAAVKGDITDVNGIADSAWITIKKKIASAAEAHQDGFVDKKDHVELTTAEKKTKIDIARKDTEVTISSRDQNVEIEALVRNYKITASVLEKKECDIHASPSPSHTAKLILALQASPDPTIIPIIESRLEAALKASAEQAPADSEIKRAFALYGQLKSQREEQTALSKVATTRKPI